MNTNQEYTEQAFYTDLLTEGVSNEKTREKIFKSIENLKSVEEKVMDKGFKSAFRNVLKEVNEEDKKSIRNRLDGIDKHLGNLENLDPDVVEEKIFEMLDNLGNKADEFGDIDSDIFSYNKLEDVVTQYQNNEILLIDVFKKFYLVDKKLDFLKKIKEQTNGVVGETRDKTDVMVKEGDEQPIPNRDDNEPNKGKIEILEKFVVNIKNAIEKNKGIQLLEKLNKTFNEYGIVEDKWGNSFSQVITDINKSLTESEAYDLNGLPLKITDFKKEIEKLRKQPDINEISQSLDKSVEIPDSLEGEITIKSNDYARIGSYKQLVNRNNEYLNLIKELEEVIVNAKYKSIDKLSWNKHLGYIIEGYKNYVGFEEAIKIPFDKLVNTLKSDNKKIYFTDKFEKELLKNLFELALVAKDEALIATTFFKDGAKGAVNLSVDRARNNYRFLTKLSEQNIKVVHGANDEKIDEIINKINSEITSVERKIEIFQNYNEDISTVNLVYLAYKLGIKNLDVLVESTYVAKQLTEYNF